MSLVENLHVLVMKDYSLITDLSEIVKEAKRCLQCSNPLCRTGCPIENDIPRFIKCVREGNFGLAAEILAERTNLPAVCGRICPHELQCEAHCILAAKNKQIRIGQIERFVADICSELDVDNIKQRSKSFSGGRVAVIGSGPAGLTIAWDLAKIGFEVCIFESQPELGGVLMYGIPEFRLPKQIVRREVEKLKKIGVSVKTNAMVGQDLFLDSLFADHYDAVCISTGNALPRSLEIPGEDLSGIVPAIYFLQMVALADTGKIDPVVVPVKFEEKVVVIGGGNVALDAGRMAKRWGASSVTLAFREKLSETRMLVKDIEQAKAEGIVFCENMVPKEFIPKPDAPAKVGKVVFTNDKLLDADVVLVAIGQRPAKRIVSTTTGIATDEHTGRIVVKEKPCGMTSRVGVFASGDVVHGPSTVVVAMREAKKVAQGIAAYVEAKKLLELCGTNT